MAVSQESLSVEVVLDSSGAIKGIKDLNGNFVELSRVMGKANTSINQVDENLAALGKTSQKSADNSSKAFFKMRSALESAFVPITALNQGLQLVSSTVGALSNTLGGFVTAFAAAESAQLNLEKALSLVGNRVNKTAAQWDVYLDRLEKATGADADLLKQLVATSLQIGLSEKQTKNLVDASVKLADVTGKELGPTFEQLLQSYKGQARALAVYAPEVANLTEEQLKNGAAVDILLSKYSNVESTFGKSLSGSIQATRIRFSDMSESVGEAIAKAINLQGALTSLQGTFATVQRVVEAIDFAKLGAETKRTAEALLVAGSAAGAFALAFSSVRTAVLATSVPLAITATKFVAIGAAIAGLVVSIDLIVRNLGRFSDVMKLIGSTIANLFIKGIAIAAESLASLLNQLPGMKTFADGLTFVAQKANSAAQSLQGIADVASEGLDLGIAGAVIEQGKSALDAFNKSASDTGKTLEGTSTKAGIRGGTLLDPEQLKKLQEEAKKAADAFLALKDSTAKLQESLTLANAELATGGKGVEAAERQYQVTLMQISVEREKAVAAGLSLKAAEEQVAKQVELAQQVFQVTQGLESQKATRQAMLDAEKTAESALAALRQQMLADNEALLRFGKSKEQIANRELQVELDKIDALQEQLAAAQKLDSYAKAELDLARRTAVEKNKAAKMPAPGSAESAPMIGGAAEAVSSVAGGPVGAFMSAAESITGFIQKLIDFVPNILNSITRIFNSLTDLPIRIFDAVKGLGNSIVRFITDAIPNLFKAIPDIVDNLITLVFERIPEAVQKLIESIPAIVQGFLDRLPDLITKLVEGLVSMMPTLVINLITAIVANLPTIIKELVMMVPKLAWALAKAVVNGIINGIKNIWNALKGVTKKVTQSLTTGISTGLKKLTGFKQGMFGITEDTSKALDPAKDLIKQINEAGRSAYTWLMKAWDVIKRGFIWIYNTLLMPFINILKATWNGMIQLFKVTWDLAIGIFKATLGLLKDIWNIINNAVLKPFIDILKATWTFIKDGIIMPIVDVLKGVWEFAKSIFDVVIDAFMAVWRFVSTVFTDPIEAFKNLWSDLKNIFKDIFNAFAKLGGVIFDAFKTALTAAWDFIKSIGTAIWGALKAAWEGGISALANFGGKIWESFKQAFAGVGSVFANIGSVIWESVKKAFTGIGSLFADTGKIIWDSMTKAFGQFGNWFKGLFKFDGGGKGAVEKFLGFDFPFIAFNQGGMVPGKANVFGDSKSNDTVPALLSPGEAVIPRSLMQDPAVAKLVKGLLSGQKTQGFAKGGLLGKVAEGAKNLGDKVGDVVIPGWVKELYDSIKRFVSGISLVDLAKNPKAYIENVVIKNAEKLLKDPFVNAMKFSQGGIVPGSGSSDNVRALLTPGEFVVSKPAVESVGAGALAMLNKGNTPMRAGDVTVNLTVNTEQPIDETFIRRTILPTMREEMRKASLRGEFVLSARGVKA